MSLENKGMSLQTAKTRVSCTVCKQGAQPNSTRTHSEGLQHATTCHKNPNEY